MFSAALMAVAGECGTSKYYEEQASAYSAATLGVDMSEVYVRFLRYLPKHARILDAGSGSGRDTLAFKERGYDVDAFDASPSLCALSTELTGVPARVQRFQEFESELLYEGIWACASLLHVPSNELPDAFRRLVQVLRSGGALYISFKHGPGERYSEDGRFYLDMNEARLRTVLGNIAGMDLAEIWISQGEGGHRGKDAWINAILVKNEEGKGSRE
ncbi:MAG: hypothetical protein AMXMBFR74_23600 [Parvibaculum sp.]|uniref:class I SAM-dependent methyltransferase n=1 Tax=Parvibaculum sp. TaxID=2024848 RepID=UPI0035B9E528